MSGASKAMVAEAASQECFPEVESAPPVNAWLEPKAAIKVIDYKGDREASEAEAIIRLDLMQMIADFRLRENRIKGLEDALKEIKKQHSYIEEFVLPERCLQVGTEAITFEVSAGTSATLTLKIKHDVKCQIDNRHLDEAFNVLYEQGHLSIDKIKTKVVPDIHHSSLKAAVTRLVDDSGEVTDELKRLFKVFESRKSVVTFKGPTPDDHPEETATNSRA